MSEEIENALQLGLETPEQIQQDWLEAKVAQAKQTLTDAQHGDNAQTKQVITKLEKLFNQVAKLPELSSAIAQYKIAFKQLKEIEPAQQLADYDDVLTRFNNAFKQTRSHLNVVDGALQQNFKSQLNTHKKQFLAQMSELTKPLEKTKAQPNVKHAM
ncbi:hypothetical protein P4S68_13195 [Pseudoalteromonas sp. Hal099]